MNYQPKRVQRKRTKGWTTPTCGCGCGKPARYVGRGTKWGNPWRVNGNTIKDAENERTITFNTKTEALRASVRFYSEAVANGWEKTPNNQQIQAELASHDLMCWCPPSQPCHATVLLEIANTEKK